MRVLFGTSAHATLQRLFVRTYLKAQFAGAFYGCAYEEGDTAKNTALLEKARAYGAAL